MKLSPLILLIFLIAACTRPQRQTEQAGTQTMQCLRTTPVMNQGGTSYCWIYAMLACTETYRIEQFNDSVRLDPDYLIQQLHKEQQLQRRLLHGKWKTTNRGTGPDALKLIEHYGLKPYNTRSGKSGGFYLYGMHYTPQEFGRSIYTPGEWKWYTSFTHHPYGEQFALEIPDNHHYNEFRNVPVDSLLAIAIAAVEAHKPVFWEGSMHNVKGDRQAAFEHGILTDDHAMAIVGLGTTASGTRYFILKNSYGEEWGRKGFALMSFDAFKRRTILIGAV